VLLIFSEFGDSTAHFHYELKVTLDDWPTSEGHYHPWLHPRNTPWQ